MWLNRLVPYAGAYSGKTDSRSLRRLAQYENNTLFQDVFMRNLNVLSTLIEWEGLPETVDPLFFEMNLLLGPTCCILYDTDFASYLGLPCFGQGKMNIYYKNSTYRAVSLNYSKTFISLTKENKDIFDIMAYPSGEGAVNANLKGVVCFDNPVSYPLIETIEIYTKRMVSAMRAIDVLEKQAKLPCIIETDEDSKLTIQTAINDIDQNVLAIYASRDVAKRLIESKTLQTQFNPAVLQVMWDHLNNLRSEMLTAFGINNLNTADKKERLLTDEIKSNDEAIALNIGYRMKCRYQFAENLKAVFGINARPHINSSVMMENVGLPSRGEINGNNQPDTGGNT